MTSDEANPEIRRDLYTGIVLAERYEVGGLIARDAVTETHLAQDRELGATAAIKFLSPQLAEDPAFAERFVAEALAAKVVRGPKIISILDAGTSGGMRYVVQDLGVVPDLKGVLQVTAEDRLKAAGIQIGTITEEVNRHNAEGRVIAQDPVAGTVVTPGMEVNLTVAMARELRG